MDGAELIEFIKSNGLEDYLIVISHDLGNLKMGPYPVTETNVNHEEQTVELW